MSRKSDTRPNERIIPIQIEEACSTSTIDEEKLEDEVSQHYEVNNRSVKDGIKRKNSAGVEDRAYTTTETILPKIHTKTVFPKEVKTSCMTTEDILSKATLLFNNVPEKIIIVFDKAEDELFSKFEFKNGDKFSPTYMLKRTLSIFLHNKKSINPKHEYALMFLNENIATWACDFTHNVEEIMEALDEINECETEDVFNMNSVFDTILSHVNIPRRSETLMPPPYIVRTLFLYNRSYTIPELDMTEDIHKLLSSQYFIFDVLMTHEVPNTSNYCQKIFNILQEFDIKQLAYFFPVERSALLLHVSMAKLLSHPLQRPLQSGARYKYFSV